EIVGAPYLERMQRDAQLPCWELHFFPIARRGRALWVPEHSDARELRNDFPEQLQPFSDQLADQLRGPRDVAARPRQARAGPACNSATSSRRHDRDGLGGLLG